MLDLDHCLSPFVATRAAIMPPPRGSVRLIRAFPDFLRNGHRRGFPAFAESWAAGKIGSPMAPERTARLSASPPLFQNRLLDLCSRIHPSVPAIIFVPVVVAGVWLGADRGYGVVQIVPLVALGLLIWTLTEYGLHRLVFHWEPDHPIGSRLHYIIHGVHPDHPNDRLRLVMPPAVSLPLAALFLGAFTLVFGTPAAYPIFSGLIVGYLAYDYTHYHVHHHTPKTKLGRRVREQHMRHHFQDHRYGFGVSSPLWDVVFRTLPRKRRY
jgi:dihydroceramide fatty acyl 2-hydroxylase